MISIKDNFKVDEKALDKGYQEAIQKEDFKTFTDKLNLPVEVTKKYTSSLEDSCEEYNHCLHCEGLDTCQNKILGYAYLPKSNGKSISFHYKPCSYKQKQDKTYAYLRNMKFYNIADNLKEANFKDIDKTIKNRFEVITWLGTFINNYSSNDKGLFLHGSFGSGKTYLVVALFNELAKKNVKSATVFWPEFLRDLKTSFNTDYEEKMEYIKTVPLLLIDDLGAESVTSWSRDEILCPILQYRMDSKLPTFITSNQTLDELEQHLSFTKDSVEKVKARRIIERIKQISIDMELISKNMRN